MILSMHWYVLAKDFQLGGLIVVNDYINEVLIDENELHEKVVELGKKITFDYKGNDLLVVGILKGALIFMADLVRNLSLNVKIDFIDVSSYGHSTTSSGVVRILRDLDESVEGKHVLIVEDIIDTGLTLKYLLSNLRSQNPESLKVCTLLDKPDRRITNVEATYWGFKIPDKFVIGYGLDYDERFRHLPHIAVLKEER